MILFLIISIYAEDTTIVESNTNNIISLMMANSDKNFSQVYNLTLFQQSFPQIADGFIEIMNAIHFERIDCLSNIVSRLKVQCSKIDPEKKKEYALEFTKCYFELTQHQDELQENEDHEIDPGSLSDSNYLVYTLIYTHIHTLCQFARQMEFNTETSKSLIGLFVSVIESSKTVENLNQTINETFNTLFDTVNIMSSTINETNDAVLLIRRQVHKFEEFAKNLFDTIQKPLNLLSNVRMFFLMVIVSIFIGIFLPEILFPMIVVTAMCFFSDKYFSTHYDWWNDSYSRFFAKIGYFAICSAYPIYRFSSNFFSITTFVLKTLKIQKDETVKIPRFGHIARQKPKRPRYC